jgi:hypothetical protein
MTQNTKFIKIYNANLKHFCLSECVTKCKDILPPSVSFATVGSYLQ